MTRRKANVVLVARDGGFVFACLRCGYRDERVMRTEYAAWGRFAGHVRTVHGGPLRRRRRKATR